ncbi:MAG: hypothetical protein QXL98_04195 [Thermofilaceae archaeon]
MPEPVITHIIGTIALLGVALLVVASISAVQRIAYIDTLSVMLSEVAESCARELVELVSLQTLGGGEYTYMKLTLPPLLGDQPYNLSLENVAENVILVRAQLQLLQQVKVVVTPNFGKAPVYAVSGVARFGEVTVSNYILIPTPPGVEPAIIAVKTGDAVYVGFTLQPPRAVSPGSPPTCLLVSWKPRIAGLAGSTQLFNFVVHNAGGSTGSFNVKVYNELGELVNQTSLAVPSRESKWGSLSLRLSTAPGFYYWRVVCEGPGPYGSWLTHDQAALEVLAGEPRVIITDYSRRLSGFPSSQALLNLTLTNGGNYPGSARVLYNGTEVYAQQLDAGQAVNVTIPVLLPKLPGTYTAELAVKTEETSYVEAYSVLIQVRSLDEFLEINWINATVEGLAGWTAKLHARVKNYGAAEATVDLLLNGSLVASGITVDAGSSVEVSFWAALPAKKGVYKWNVSLTSSGTLQDSVFVTVTVKELIGPISSAFLRQDFSSTPGDWVAYGGEWEVDQKKEILSGRERRERREIGEPPLCSEGNVRLRRCAVTYYWGGSISDYASGFTAIVRLYFDPSDQDVYRGFALLNQSRQKLYAVAVFRAGNTSARLLLESFESKSWTTLDVSPSVGNLAKGWYTLFLSYSYGGGAAYFVYELYDSSAKLLLAKESRVIEDFEPYYLALFISGGAGEFDDVVAATGDSRYVKVYGLPAGWAAELRSGGQLIARSVSSGSGEVSLPVVSKPILSSAELVIVDPYGRVALRKSYTVLVGGDAFYLVSS